MDLERMTSTEENLKKGRWVAIQTEEYGWLAGPITFWDGVKLTVRATRRKLNHLSPSIKSLDGWDEINPIPMTFFSAAKNMPRILPMSITTVAPVSTLNH